MNVDDVIRERIAAARARTERRRRQRAALQRARAYGLAARKRAKLRRDGGDAA
ncbi:hypothetical protein ACG5V6_14980 [Streptomyces chitinivorans]|uniref:Uncharacterized protein n=1 Tax=Streptomyces chitinivorans TaxID=1257027 RepID=A0ABW7HUG8_9ACTN|nr:hypothetical protein [Streptomyces chitinivorans]MDH2407180.1 hypothetical protein [Streptomyces chitinivorans]